MDRLFSKLLACDGLFYGLPFSCLGIGLDDKPTKLKEETRWLIMHGYFDWKEPGLPVVSEEPDLAQKMELFHPITLMNRLLLLHSPNDVGLLSFMACLFMLMSFLMSFVALLL